jgi:hypothetical protein
MTAYFFAAIVDLYSKSCIKRFMQNAFLYQTRDGSNNHQPEQTIQIMIF